MFSKEESIKLRKEFWTSFGKSFPRKWILYNTKVKGFSFKFQADRKNAMVCLDFEHPEEIANALLYDQLLSLKSILMNDYLPNAIFEETFILDSGKQIRRIYIPYKGKFSIYNKNSWRSCYEFFVKTMTKFENFFKEYEDFIKQAI